MLIAQRSKNLSIAIKRYNIKDVPRAEIKEKQDRLEVINNAFDAIVIFHQPQFAPNRFG